MDEPTIIVSGVPSQLPLHATWGSGNQLFFHGGAPQQSTTTLSAFGGGAAHSTKAAHVSGFNCVSELRWETLGNSRPLLAAWHDIFVRIQREGARYRANKRGEPLSAAAGGDNDDAAAAANASNAMGDEEFRLYLLEESHWYHAELDAFLRDAASQPDPPTPLSAASASAPSSSASSSSTPAAAAAKEERLAHLKLLEVGKIIWHLCEIFFVNPNENVTAQLAAWQKLCVPSPTTTAAATAVPDTDAHWQCICE
jgi:hypothetical protein